ACGWRARDSSGRGGGTWGPHGEGQARRGRGSVAVRAGHRQVSRRAHRRGDAARGGFAVKGFEPARRLRGIEKSAIRQFFDRAPAGSINFGLGEPDLPTPDVVRQAAVRAILDERNGYTTHAGLPVLRERVAGEYASLGAEPDRVIITAGSQEALYLALTALVDEGDEVLLPDPGFVAYPTIVRMAGGRPVFYKLPAARDFGLDIDDFRRKLSKRTKVVVCISPSNPTGRALTPADLKAMAAALAGHGALVVSDEIYRELHFGDAR